MRRRRFPSALRTRPRKPSSRGHSQDPDPPRTSPSELRAMSRGRRPWYAGARERVPTALPRAARPTGWARPSSSRVRSPLACSATTRRVGLRRWAPRPRRREHGGGRIASCARRLLGPHRSDSARTPPRDARARGQCPSVLLRGAALRSTTCQLGRPWHARTARGREAARSRSRSSGSHGRIDRTAIRGHAVPTDPRRETKRRRTRSSLPRAARPRRCVRDGVVERSFPKACHLPLHFSRP